MKRKRLTASIIALVMSVSLPMTTYAANWYLEDGSVTVNADNSGQTVTQGSGSAVPDEAPVITQRNSSAETSNTITINASENATANVTISNVNIDTSSAAIATSGKGNVNIELDGTNTLKSGRYHAGLEKSQDGKLTITDENANGKLIATGGDYGAGIGGDDQGNGKNITITGGEVTAAGGTNGAGIVRTCLHCKTDESVLHKAHHILTASIYIKFSLKWKCCLNPLYRLAFINRNIHKKYSCLTVK